MPWCPDSDDNGALLITACNAIEADLLESKLKAYGIPVLRKYKGFGDYLNIYMGATPFGVDLYVPAELLEKARDIVSIQDVPDDSPEPAQMQEDGDRGIRLRRMGNRNIRSRWMARGIRSRRKIPPRQKCIGSRRLS